jgi:hypothetical protein
MSKIANETKIIPDAMASFFFLVKVAIKNVAKAVMQRYIHCHPKITLNILVLSLPTTVL